MKRTAADAARTREALLAAALLAFAEHGWRGATFERVAERAGLTRGALHHHFRSKEALLQQALSWGWTRYGERIFRVREEPALAALLADFVALLRDDALFRALAASTVLVAPQALDDPAEKNAALDSWQEQIAAMLPHSAAAPREAVAGLALVLLQGLTVTAVTRPTDLPHPTELRATLVALSAGVLP